MFSTNPPTASAVGCILAPRCGFSSATVCTRHSNRRFTQNLPRRLSNLPLRGLRRRQRTSSAFFAGFVTPSSRIGPSWPRAETFFTESTWPLRTITASSKLFTVGHTWRGRR